MAGVILLAIEHHFKPLKRRKRCICFSREPGMLRSGHNTVHVIWAAEGAVKGRDQTELPSIRRRRARVRCTEYDSTPKSMAVTFQL